MEYLSNIFLNAAGRTYFPLWMQQIETVLSDFEGFISINLLKDIENEGRTLLFLNFASLDALHGWTNSDSHAQELAKLEKFMIRKQESRTFEVMGTQ